MRKLFFSPKFMMLSFFIREPGVIRKQQEYLYRFSNFVADVGGYLGLLLGLSIFSFYQFLADLGAKLIKANK